MGEGGKTGHANFFLAGEGRPLRISDTGVIGEPPGGRNFVRYLHPVRDNLAAGE